MSNFQTHLELEYIDGRMWRVTRNFEYDVNLGPNIQGTIIVPEGFTTDFASIPRILWNILPATGKYGEAAVVHDYLYVCGGHVPQWQYTFTKKDADRIFLQAMTLLEVPAWQRYPMYQAVRWFGRGSF